MPGANAVLKNQIESINNQIDNLVYRLYSLTPDEIHVVEGNDKNEG
jgi:hypothetical protein